MTERRINLILGVIFLMVGIVATTNTVRLNTYIRETLPRDQAQEQCTDKTLTVLKSWIEDRTKRDTTMDTRDDSIIKILDEIIDGQKPSQVDLKSWRDATIADREVRQNTTSTRQPLPDCQTGLQ